MFQTVSLPCAAQPSLFRLSHTGNSIGLADGVLSLAGELQVFHVRRKYQSRSWFCLFAGGATSPLKELVTFNLDRPASPLVVHACQHLWLVTIDDLYQ